MVYAQPGTVFYGRVRRVEVTVPGRFVTALPRLPRPARPPAYAELRALLAGAPRTAGEGTFTARASVPVGLLPALVALAETAAHEWEGTDLEDVAVGFSHLVSRRGYAEQMRRDVGCDDLWAVVIAKPGYDTVRIGPVPHRNTAQSMARHMEANSGTARPEGTTVQVEPYEDGVEHLMLLPNDADALSMMMDAMPGGDGHGGEFPDLFMRLSAQYGSEEAGSLWSRACAAYDYWHHVDAESV